MERQIARFILQEIGASMSSPDEFDKLVEDFARTIKLKFGDPILPNDGESLALSVMTPKTAALAFDRVYRIPTMNEPVPKEIGFYCATTPEIGYWAAGLAMVAAKQVGIQVGIDFFENTSTGPKNAAAEKENLRFLCSEFQQLLGSVPTIFYHAEKSRLSDFSSGTHQVLTAAIANIAMVDEESLSWDQVLEFRKDRETRAKYCRFVRWADAELRTQSSNELKDTIAIRLDDYQWSLQKHGLKASIGALSCLLDPKFLGTTSATIAASAIAGGGVWAALAGGSLVVGQAAVTIGTTLINGLEERRKENYEVAYVYELQKRLGKCT